MGTQQLLMVILSVIVVGTAVAVGIQMFDTSSQNLSRQALVQDVIRMGVEAQAWYRTASIMGGGGGNFNHPNFPADPRTKIIQYIDNSIRTDFSAYTIRNENGSFVFDIAPNSELLHIYATSNYSTQKPIMVYGRIFLSQGFEGITVDPYHTD